SASCCAIRTSCSRLPRKPANASASGYRAAQRCHEAAGIDIMLAAGVIDRMKRRNRAADAAELEIKEHADRRRPAGHHVVNEQIGFNRHARLHFEGNSLPKPSEGSLLRRNLADESI